MLEEPPFCQLLQTPDGPTAEQFLLSGESIPLRHREWLLDNARVMTISILAIRSERPAEFCRSSLEWALSIAPIHVISEPIDQAEGDMAVREIAAVAPKVKPGILTVVRCVPERALEWSDLSFELGPRRLKQIRLYRGCNRGASRPVVR